jgi:hypothetical protein
MTVQRDNPKVAVSPGGLRRALAEALPGACLVLEPGTYQGRFRVTKGLSLVGGRTRRSRGPARVAGSGAPGLRPSGPRCSADGTDDPGRSQPVWQWPAHSPGPCDAGPVHCASKPWVRARRRHFCRVGSERQAEGLLFAAQFSPGRWRCLCGPRLEAGDRSVRPGRQPGPPWGRDCRGPFPRIGREHSIHWESSLQERRGDRPSKRRFTEASSMRVGSK